MATDDLSDVHQLQVSEITTIKRIRWSYVICGNMAYIFKQLAWNKLFLTLLTYLVCLNICYARPVPLPSGNFKCGPPLLNLTCESFGFDACISDNNEFYCLPCNHEYLDTTCGTHDEQPGCNLYCTEKAVEREKEILTSNFTKQLDSISKQAILSKEKNSFQTSRIQSLENNIRNKDIFIYVLIAALVVAFTVTIIFIIWCITRYKTEHDVENQKSETETSEMKSLIMEDKSDNVTEQLEDPQRNSLPDNMRETNISGPLEQIPFEHELEQNNYNSQEKECPVMTKLSNMPPTNAEGSNKLAITQNDHIQPERTIA